MRVSSGDHMSPAWSWHLSYPRINVGEHAELLPTGFTNSIRTADGLTDLSESTLAQDERRTSRDGHENMHPDTYDPSLTGQNPNMTSPMQSPQYGHGGSLAYEPTLGYHARFDGQGTSFAYSNQPDAYPHNGDITYQPKAQENFGLTMAQATLSCSSSILGHHDKNMSPVSETKWIGTEAALNTAPWSVVNPRNVESPWHLDNQVQQSVSGNRISEASSSSAYARDAPGSFIDDELGMPITPMSTNGSMMRSHDAPQHNCSNATFQMTIQDEGTGFPGICDVTRYQP